MGCAYFGTLRAAKSVGTRTPVTVPTKTLVSTPVDPVTPFWRKLEKLVEVLVKVMVVVARDDVRVSGTTEVAGIAGIVGVSVAVNVVSMVPCAVMVVSGIGTAVVSPPEVMGIADVREFAAVNVVAVVPRAVTVVSSTMAGTTLVKTDVRTAEGCLVTVATIDVERTVVSSGTVTVATIDVEVLPNSGVTKDTLIEVTVVAGITTGADELVEGLGVAVTVDVKDVGLVVTEVTTRDVEVAITTVEVETAPPPSPVGMEITAEEVLEVVALVTKVADDVELAAELLEELDEAAEDEGEEVAPTDADDEELDGAAEDAEEEVAGTDVDEEELDEAPEDAAEELDAELLTGGEALGAVLEDAEDEEVTDGEAPDDEALELVPDDTDDDWVAEPLAGKDPDEDEDVPEDTADELVAELVAGRDPGEELPEL